MYLGRIYQHFSPVRLIFGPGSLARLLGALGSAAKLLIVTDRGIAGAGILDRVTGVLSEAGIEFAVYDGVTPDPPVKVVEEALALYRDQGCQALLAVGGGSPIDAAKAVGVGATNPGRLQDYGSGQALDSPLPPLTAVPTTAGTGSEVTGVAVISDPERTIKMVIRGVELVPQTAVLDPLLLAGLPPRIAAETGADALSHALEALVTRAAQPVTDALALHAVRLIFRWLRPMVGDPAEVEAAGGMLIASAMASLAFANAGLGLVHALAHPVGANYHLSHGLACALLLPVVMEFNTLAGAAKYRAAAEAMGLDVGALADHEAARAAIEAVRELFRDVGLPASYADAGIDFKLKEEMVAEVLSVPTHKANPRRSDRDQIVALFHAPA